MAQITKLCAVCNRPFHLDFEANLERARELHPEKDLKNLDGVSITCWDCMEEMNKNPNSITISLEDAKRISDTEEKGWE